MFKIPEFDIRPIARPGGGDEYLYVGALGGAEEEEGAVEVEERVRGVGVDYGVDAGDGEVECGDVVVGCTGYEGFEAGGEGAREGGGRAAETADGEAAREGDEREALA